MKRLTILDGGMGRELKRMGAPFSQPLWSAQALIESPQCVELAHTNFIDAGAQIITTNSYACVPFHLGQERFNAEGANLAEKAAKIARLSADKASHAVQVAGALPPAFGSYRPDLFRPAEAKQIFNLLYQAQDQYVDIWLAETISSLEELDAIASILSQTEKSSYYAFTLADTTSGSAQLRSGQSVREATTRVCAAGGDGVFFNCSVPEAMVNAVTEAKQVLDELGRSIEIGVYANNFTPIGNDHEANDTIQAMRELTPQDYLEYSKAWFESGATIIGGCCGIGPEHIKVLSEWQSTLKS
ncbi:homocysteine S-methyltransferase family protein [Vibrio tubiashii]|nr:homocysteine S-methyltransferase family protein [Vibrio tubiashii]